MPACCAAPRPSDLLQRSGQSPECHAGLGGVKLGSPSCLSAWRPAQGMAGSRRALAALAQHVQDRRDTAPRSRRLASGSRHRHSHFPAAIAPVRLTNQPQRALRQHCLSAATTAQPSARPPPPPHRRRLPRPPAVAPSAPVSPAPPVPPPRHAGPARRRAQRRRGRAGDADRGGRQPGTAGPVCECVVEGLERAAARVVGAAWRPGTACSASWAARGQALERAAAEQAAADPSTAPACPPCPPCSAEAHGAAPGGLGRAAGVRQGAGGRGRAAGRHRAG